MILTRKLIHEKYHSKRWMQKRVINKYNFTYYYLLKVISPYLNKKIKVADVGCGVGTIPFYVASKGIDVAGFDISKNAIRIAKANAKYLKVNKKIVFKVVDFPQSDIYGKYDLIIITEVLEHLSDDYLAISKLRKHLNKGGLIIASSPSINAPLYKLGLLRNFDKKVGHLRRYSEKEFKNLFLTSGFNVLKFYRSEGILRNFLFTNDYAGKLVRYLRWHLSASVNFLDRLTIPHLGESQYYIVARKK